MRLEICSQNVDKLIYILKQRFAFLSLPCRAMCRLKLQEIHKGQISLSKMDAKLVSQYKRLANYFYQLKEPKDITKLNLPLFYKASKER